MASPRRGWRYGSEEVEEEDLENRSKGAPEKVAMAEVLKARTDATSRWIAEQLRMGSVGHMSRRLVDAGQRNPPAKIPHSKAKATQSVVLTPFIRLNPSFAQFHADLGGVLFRAGRRMEARDAAQHAIRLGFRQHWVYRELGLEP